MPVRLQSATARLARLNPSLEAFSPNFDGAVDAPASFTATIGANLQADTASFLGNYQAVSDITGTIGVTLDNFTSNITSNISQTIAGPFNVFPLPTEGNHLSNDTGITNGSAVWRVIAETPLDGSFTYTQSGFTYTSGSQTGSASFTYEIIDFDGAGSNTQATVTVDVVPYDLSGFTSIEWTPVWPTVPNTTNTVNVSTIGDFQTYASAGGYLINVAAGTYNGNLTIASDTDIVMSNAATLNGTFSHSNSSRVRWTGGNINMGSSSVSRSDNWDDVLFDDVYIEGKISHQGSGSSRFAFINSTIQSLGYTDFSWYASPSTGRLTDYILANVRHETEAGPLWNNGDNSTFRFQKHDRCLIVDSVFNMSGYCGTGIRVGEESDYLHVEDTAIAGRIFHSYQEFGNQNVSNARYENVTRYTAPGTPATYFASFNPPANDGVVNNSQLYSYNSGDAGSSLQLGDFTTEDGNPTILSYDSGQAPSVAFGGISSYGAQR